MRFNNQLRFNSNPEWFKEYLDYGALRGIIAEMEEAQRTAYENVEPSSESPEPRTSVDLEKPLIGESRRSFSYESGRKYLTPGMNIETEEDFIVKVNLELEKICSFFIQKSWELRSELQRLEQEVTRIEEATRRQCGADLTRQQVWNQKQKEDIKEEVYFDLVCLHCNLYDIEHFVQLNREGFRKVIKKYDKNLHAHLTDTLMPAINKRLQALHVDAIPGQMERARALFADIVCNGNAKEAEFKLKQKLRHHVSYDRDVVWRELVEEEGLHHTVVVHHDEKAEARALRKKIVFLVLSIAAFVAILLSPQFMKTRQMQNCLAMLTLALSLWILEVLDLYATALLVPIIATMLGLLDPTPAPDPPYLPRVAGYHATLQAMWSDPVLLLLGGFTIAAAFSKTRLAKLVASLAMRAFGDRPKAILLGSMLLATILSAFISNVAAPVLMYSVIEPFLRTHDAQSPISQTLVLGIAFAANIGGMVSPISSPQNIITVESMKIHGVHPGWGVWLAISLPVSLVSLLGIYVYMVSVKFRNHPPTARLAPLEEVTVKWDWRQAVTAGVTVVTIGMWVANASVAKITGGMGMTAFIPISVLFATRILKKDDLKLFPWDVIFLAMGGLVLGKCVDTTGILHVVADFVLAHASSMPLLAVFAALNAVVAIVANFVSHTVASIVFVPLAVQIGRGLGRENMVVMGTGLMCSAAMALQVSGFPNMIASNKVDGLGRRYAPQEILLHFGVVSTFISYVVGTTLGYWLMSMVLSEGGGA